MQKSKDKFSYEKAFFVIPMNDLKEYTEVPRYLKHAPPPLLLLLRVRSIFKTSGHSHSDLQNQTQTKSREPPYRHFCGAGWGGYVLIQRKKASAAWPTRRLANLIGGVAGYASQTKTKVSELSKT